MDEQRRQTWGKALLTATAYLSRWSDPITRDSREDMAQDTALAVWRCTVGQAGVPCIGALVRTISHRLRMRALLHFRRVGNGVADGDLDSWPAPACEDDTCLRVCGKLVSRSWLVEKLNEALRSLSSINRQLVRAFYEGFSCRELAERFGLSEDAVKVRLHRSRVRLRRRLEAEARAAGHLEA